MTTSLVRTGVVKELKALLIPWLLVLSAVVIAGLTEDAPLVPIAVVGAVSLGAWSVGQEYSYRTLPLLLSQPVGRQTLAMTKAVSLTPLLLVVCATAMVLSGEAGDVRVIGLGLAGALSLAPLLTMVSRSARGGILFTLAIGLVWVMVGIRTGEAIAVRNPDRWTDPFGFAESVVYGGFAVIFGVAAVLGWRRFQSLGAADEQAEHLTLPSLGLGRRRVLASTARFRHPLVALLGKELGLQMPVFALSTVYGLAWVGSWFLRPTTREALIMVATMLHGGLAPLLAGALASAEERRMGTLSTQLLQPVSAGVQWAVKATVVIGLAVLLAVGLPAVLRLVDPALLADGSLRQVALGLGFFRLRDMTAMFAVTAMLAALSLYVSSLTRNSLHALLASIAAGVVLWSGLAYGLRLIAMADSRVMQELIWQRRELLRTREVLQAFVAYSRDLTHAYETLILVTVVTVVVGGLWLFLRFGNENHRFEDHRSSRVGLQVIAILLVPVAALVFYHSLPAWIFRG